MSLAARLVSTPNHVLSSRLPAPTARKLVAVPREESSTSRDPDAALVAKAKAGDTRAYELLVRKHQNRIIALVRRIVGDADSEDVAQETFIRAFRALPGFHGDSLFSTWLYRIAVNYSKNHLQSRNCRPSFQDIDVADAELFGHTEQLSHNNTPEHEVLSEEIKDRIAHAIRRLPEELRRAIVLRELQGLSYEDMPVEMRCPLGTVRSRIFRAREAIDAQLAPLLG